MVTGSHPRSGMPPGVGYDAAMAWKFGLLMFVCSMSWKWLKQQRGIRISSGAASAILRPFCIHNVQRFQGWLLNSVHKLSTVACTCKKPPGLTSRPARAMPKNICQRLPQKLSPGAALRSYTCIICIQHLVAFLAIWNWFCISGYKGIKPHADCLQWRDKTWIAPGDHGRRRVF